MVLLPIEKVPSCISTTWYLYLMVLLPSIHHTTALTTPPHHHTTTPPSHRYQQAAAPKEASEYGQAHFLGVVQTNVFLNGQNSQPENRK